MQFSTNKTYQYLFFLILSFNTVFNGGNSNLIIQCNFIFVGIFFLACLKYKNYTYHLKNFYFKNKNSLFIFLLFVFFLILQMTPISPNYLKYFSPEKYNLINGLEFSLKSAISLSPSESYFQTINYISLILIIFICKMIFYTERHKFRFYLFLSTLGFFTSFIAVFIYLNGNPDFFIFKNSNYKNASTGFFINRTVFSIFLLFCLISSLEILKNFDKKNNNTKNRNFFTPIYVRLFIAFIAIGIITSFSRIGNFLLLITILYYIINDIRHPKVNSYNFRLIVILIILFDLIILGFYFGTPKLVSRFYFLQEEFSNMSDEITTLSRFDIIKFSIYELKNFLFFGYGSGAFEILFQIKFSNSNQYFANHAHSDLIEFVGEYGLLGTALLFCSFVKIFFNKKFFSSINLLLIFYSLIILSFDFSLHIPIIQMLFVIFFVLNQKLLS